MSTRPYHSSRRSRSPSSHHRNPYRNRHANSHSPQARHQKQPTPLPPPITLPFGARPLKKRHYEVYKPMFALYLDIQKQLVLEEMEEREVKGRWKRFVGKWNRGELAEGWYDPETLRKAQISAAATEITHDEDHIPSHASDFRQKGGANSQHEDEDDEAEDEDAFGPALPSQTPSAPSEVTAGRSSRQSGPSIPKLQDLQLQRELAQESTLQSLSTLRQARKQDLHLQKQALEDLAPRAEPGTKARQLEKKADLRFSNNQFAVSKSDNTFVEIPEVELMGGDDDDGEGGIEGFKKKKAEEERKKNDREVRREEILRARREEREERMRAYREKEERTMEGLVALARARFG